MDRFLAAAATGLAFVSGAASVPAPQQISADPFLAGVGQHETAVEPDSLSFGKNVVSVFQLGRVVDGGATANGWATSLDGGLNWRSGVLPALTVFQQPAGPYSRVSDPVIAFDRLHGAWLGLSLALRDTPTDRLSSVVVNRSSDGISWSGPQVVAPEVGRFDHDKPWLVCDNGLASPRAGHCYAVWTRNPGNAGFLAVAVSTDGGLTWSEGRSVERVQGSGWQPLVGPDGLLTVVYEGTGEIAAVTSRDGGRTFTRPTRVGFLRARTVQGLRAPALPSAEIDAAGRIYVAWQDCRFSPACASNELVLASSPDGVRWSRVRRVPTWPEFDRLTHFVPGLGVDASTQGNTARLALAFNVFTLDGIVAAFTSSTDGGRTWSAPQRLAPPRPIDAFPQSTSGRFLGDYISTSFVDAGAAVPVFASAASPFDGGFHQGIFATRIPPLTTRGPLLRLGPAKVVPRNPRVGQRVSVTVSITGPARATAASCSARRSNVAALVRGRRATCSWVLRAVGPGATIGGKIRVSSPEEEAARPFSFRVRRG